MSTIDCSQLVTSTAACSPSYIRLLNALPEHQAVDVVVNGSVAAGALAYKDTAGYFLVPPCMYAITAYPVGRSKAGENSIAEACLRVCPKSAMTIAIIGGCSGLLGVQESFDSCRRQRNACKALVRFVNLSPNAPSLDVSFLGGERLFAGVPYTARTRYTPVNEGTYSFLLKPAGSLQPGIAGVPITLTRCTRHTIYAVGYAGGTPPLETIMLIDGKY